MNSKQELPAVDPADQGREWFVRLLDSNVGPGEIEAWETWMRSPDNARAFNAVAEAWALSGLVAPMRASISELTNDAYEGREPVGVWRRTKPRPRLLWQAAAAASLLVAATGAFVLWERTGVQPIKEISTARAERKDAILSDGSEVKLAAQTQISVAYERKRRLVSIKKGEALFDVAKDEARPFIVRTNHADITAVGTTFDVHVSAQRILLSVTEGAVNVRRTAASSAMTPRQTLLRVEAPRQLEISARGTRFIADDMGGAGGPAWLRGRLEFRAQPLSTVLEDVNRYAAQPIMVEDASVGALAYTGTIDLNLIDVWVRGLTTAFPLIVENRPDAFVLRRKKTSVGLPGASSRSS